MDTSLKEGDSDLTRDAVGAEVCEPTQNMSMNRQGTTQHHQSQTKLRGSYVIHSLLNDGHSQDRQNQNRAGVENKDFRYGQPELRPGKELLENSQKDFCSLLGKE